MCVSTCASHSPVSYVFSGVSEELRGQNKVA